MLRFSPPLPQLQQCEAALNYHGQRADHFEKQLLQKSNGLGPQDMPVGPSPAESELQLSLNNMHAQVLDLQAKLAEQEERYAAKDAECMGHWMEEQRYMLQVVNTETKAKREAAALKQERDNLAAQCAALTDERTRLDANQLGLLDCLVSVLIVWTAQAACVVRKRASCSSSSSITFLITSVLDG